MKHTLILAAVLISAPAYADTRYHNALDQWLCENMKNFKPELQELDKQLNPEGCPDQKQQPKPKQQDI